MAEALTRQSPLAGPTAAPAETSFAAVALRELPFLAQVNLRADPAAAAALAAPFGLTLPEASNTVAGGEALAALWLGPDEWLVVGPDGSETVTETGVRAAGGDAVRSVVDVSGQRTVLELRGPAAREVLSGGCSLDLHPRAFGPGRCAQTLLARADVILWQTDGETYRIFVGASFAPYLAAWLTDAMAETASLPDAAGHLVAVDHRRGGQRQPRPVTRG